MRVEREVLFWLAVLVAAVLLAGLLKSVLFPFAAGFLIAYALHPAVDGVAAAGSPRWLAAAAVILLAMAAAVAVVILVAPLALDQARQLVTALPGEAERVRGLAETSARDWLGPGFPGFEAWLDRAGRTLSDNWTSLAAWAAASLWNQGLALFYLLSFVLVSPLVAFYLLADWPRMIAKIDSWLPRAHAPTVRKVASEINHAMAAFIRGQGAVCLILAAFYAIGLTALGLQYGLVVGLLTGLSSFVPVVGWALGFATAMAIAAAQHSMEAAPLLAIAAVFLAGQVLDAAILSPNIVGSRIGLHPVWLIFSLFVFSALFGVVGVLLAVPLAAAIGVLARFALSVYLKSDVYDGAVEPRPGKVTTGSSS